MSYCSWVNLKNKLYVDYHEKEWGVPVYDDRLLFEMLSLEIFSSGLSWECVLNKRENFKKFFDNFDVKKIVLYDENKQVSFMKNDLLIKNLAKYKSVINNAKVFLEIQKQFGSFSNYIWGWTDSKVMLSDGIETKSELSNKITNDLKNRGMSFIGTITIFTYLCAIGVIYSHQKDCYLYIKS